MTNATLLQHLLINTTKNNHEKIALIIGNKQYTYNTLLNSAILLATKMKKKGLKRGDRVVVKTGNVLETIISFWATLLADGIISIVASDTTEEKIHYILNDSDASVFISNHRHDTVINHLPTFPHLKQLYLLNKDHIDIDNSVFYNDDLPLFKNNELDLASIIYTSGSTGEPKGVMLTHRNMLTATDSINQYLQHNNQDVILSALPLAFDYGLYQMIMAFSVGATLILEKDALFPAHLLKKIDTYKVTMLPCVPTLFSLLILHGERFKYDYSSLRAVTNTGAALRVQHIDKIQKLFPHAQLFSMYGLTECKRCTYLPPELIHQKPDSVGIAIPNTELWIVDDQDQKVGPNVLGQLVIRGATVMKGYWKKPEETNKRLKEGSVPGEKVLYTGDYALLDQDGHLYFKGRMDEVIKFKGIKLSPIELETTLGKLTDISEVAVFGHEDGIGDVKLIICVSAAQGMSEDSVEERVRKALPLTQQPNHIFFYKSLPKNENGKINKKSLKQEVDIRMTAMLTDQGLGAAC